MLTEIILLETLCERKSTVKILNIIKKKKSESEEFKKKDCISDEKYLCFKTFDHLNLITNASKI